MNTDSHRLQHRAIYSGGSICESGLPVHDSHRLKAQSYLNTTYSGGSICVSGLLVHTGTDCSHRAISMLSILVEVCVNVAYRSMISSMEIAVCLQSVTVVD